MLNIVKFFNEVKQEGRKVTWAPKNESLSITAVVLVMVVISAIFFLFLDWVIYSLLGFLLNL